MNLQDDIDECYDEEAGDFLASYGFDGYNEERGGIINQPQMIGPHLLSFGTVMIQHHFIPRSRLMLAKRQHGNKPRKKLSFYEINLDTSQLELTRHLTFFLVNQANSLASSSQSLELDSTNTLSSWPLSCMNASIVLYTPSWSTILTT